MQQQQQQQHIAVVPLPAAAAAVAASETVVAAAGRLAQRQLQLQPEQHDVDPSPDQDMGPAPPAYLTRQRRAELASLPDPRGDSMPDISSEQDLLRAAIRHSTRRKGAGQQRSVPFDAQPVSVTGSHWDAGDGKTYYEVQWDVGGMPARNWETLGYLRLHYGETENIIIIIIKQVPVWWMTGTPTHDKSMRLCSRLRSLTLAHQTRPTAGPNPGLVARAAALSSLRACPPQPAALWQPPTSPPMPPQQRQQQQQQPPLVLQQHRRLWCAISMSLGASRARPVV